MPTNKDTRILLISPFFHPHKGGSQRYMEELYGHLLDKHRNVSIDVLTYNTDHVAPRESYRGMKIYRIPCWHVLPGQFAIPNVLALLRFLITMRLKKYNIVHTHLRFFDATWWAWAYAKTIGAVSVFTEHVASHPVHKDAYITDIAKWIDLTIARSMIGKYDVITATNKSAREFLKNTMHVKKSIYLTYGGVDTEFFSPKRKQNRRIPHIKKLFTPKDTIIVYAGRIIWSKGITYAYRAIREGMKSWPQKTYMVFAGPGNLLSDVREEIRKDGLENRIFTTGSLEAREIRDALRASDIFLHPSHHNEGFPNVILEAGATENFVIATHNAGVAEAITDKKHAFLIEQKNEREIKRTLRWAITHPKERKAMAKEFRRHIYQKFEWKSLSRKFYVLLHEKLEQRKEAKHPALGAIKSLALLS